MPALDKPVVVWEDGGVPKPSVTALISAFQTMIDASGVDDPAAVREALGWHMLYQARKGREGRVKNNRTRYIELTVRLPVCNTRICIGYEEDDTDVLQKPGAR